MRILACLLSLALALGGAACGSAPPAADGTPAATAAPGEGADATAGLPPRDQDDVAAVIGASREHVERCYQLALMRAPELGGRLVVKIVIAAAGHVAEATVVHDDLGSPETARCVAGVFGQLRFAPASEATTVNYPITFATERGP